MDLVTKTYLALLLAVILVYTGLFYPFDLEEEKTFFVDKGENTIRVEYSPTERIDSSKGTAFAFFRPEPYGKKGNYLIRIAGDHKNFLELVNSCTHEMIHYDLAWEGMNSEQQHSYMREHYGNTSLTVFKPECYLVTSKLLAS